MELKKQPIKRFLLITLLLVFATYLNGCCPCYFSNISQTTTGVKGQFDVLFNAATDDYSNHLQDVTNAGTVIDQAISTNAKRKCKTMVAMWGQIKNKNSNGVYDNFVRTWKNGHTLNPITISSVKSRVTLLLDSINSGEDKIKKAGKKECK